MFRFVYFEKEFLLFNRISVLIFCLKSSKVFMVTHTNLNFQSTRLRFWLSMIFWKFQPKIEICMGYHGRISFLSIDSWSPLNFTHFYDKIEYPRPFLKIFIFLPIFCSASSKRWDSLGCQKEPFKANQMRQKFDTFNFTGFAIVWH